MKRKSNRAAARKLRKLLQKGGFSLFLLCCAAPSGWAQEEYQPQVEPSSDLDVVPFSAVIRDEEPPYERMFRPLRAGATLDPQIGAGGEGRLEAGIFGGPRIGTPFDRAIRPEDAELKLGPVLFDLRSVSGSVLFSDNINQTEINREADVIAILRAEIALMLRITEGLQLAVAGTIAYLPLENEIGIAVVDDFLARINYGPLARAQLSYDLKVGDWEILVFDDLSIRNHRAAEGVNFELFDSDEAFDAEDRAGRYVYRARGAGFRSDAGLPDRDRRGLNEVVAGARNLVGASASGMLPTVTRLTVGASHADHWYFNRPDDVRLPSYRNEVYGTLISERETLRFKPYLTVRAIDTDLTSGWYNEAHTGARGPITENIDIWGDVGYLWGDRDRDSLLWRIRLRHTPNERMYHQVQYSKRVTEPEFEVSELASYRLRYVLSEDLRVELFGVREEFDRVTGFNGGLEEHRAGIRFTYDLAQRTVLRIGAVYTDIESNDRRAAHTQRWTSRLELIYRYTQTVEARLLYQHEIRESNLPLDDYTENLVVLTLVKFF